MKKNNAHSLRKESDKPMTLADRPNKFITEQEITKRSFAAVRRKLYTSVIPTEAERFFPMQLPPFTRNGNKNTCELK